MRSTNIKPSVCFLGRDAVSPNIPSSPLLPSTENARSSSRGWASSTSISRSPPRTSSVHPGIIDNISSTTSSPVTPPSSATLSSCSSTSGPSPSTSTEGMYGGLDTTTSNTVPTPPSSDTTSENRPPPSDFQNSFARHLTETYRSFHPSPSTVAAFSFDSRTASSLTSIPTTTARGRCSATAMPTQPVPHPTSNTLHGASTGIRRSAASTSSSVSGRGQSTGDLHATSKVWKSHDPRMYWRGSWRTLRERCERSLSRCSGDGTASACSPCGRREKQFGGRSSAFVRRCWTDRRGSVTSATERVEAAIGKISRTVRPGGRRKVSALVSPLWDRGAAKR
mmetsp:Transcript_36341/g.71485  ORF Transcript_36341/g.71485 Transcript_36341/m.71485 type:complete len:337 (-) Transcript_36341:382-1392(-)